MGTAHGTAMLLSLSLLNVFETTLQGSCSNQTTISLIPSLEWNGTKEGEHTEKRRRSRQRNAGVCRGSLQRMQRELTGNAEGVYREMQRKFTGVYRETQREFTEKYGVR